MTGRGSDRPDSPDRLLTEALLGRVTRGLSRARRQCNIWGVFTGRLTATLFGREDGGKGFCAFSIKRLNGDRRLERSVTAVRGATCRRHTRAGTFCCRYTGATR